MWLTALPKHPIHVLKWFHSIHESVSEANVCSVNSSKQLLKMYGFLFQFHLYVFTMCLGTLSALLLHVGDLQGVQGDFCQTCRACCLGEFVLKLPNIPHSEAEQFWRYRQENF